MHEGSYKDRKNYIKDQKSKSSTIGTFPHPNRTIVWNECLMKSATRVEEWELEMHIDKKLRALNTFFNNMLFSLKTGLPFLA